MGDLILLLIPLLELDMRFSSFFFLPFPPLPLLLPLTGLQAITQLRSSFFKKSVGYLRLISIQEFKYLFRT